MDTGTENKNNGREDITCLTALARQTFKAETTPFPICNVNPLHKNSVEDSYVFTPESVSFTGAQVILKTAF